MLKMPSPGVTRVAFGFILAALFVAGGTFSAWAAQAPGVAPGAPAAAAPVNAAAPATDADFIASDAPVYPQAAIDARQQGKITLKVLIDAHGAPISAEVFAADPPAVRAVFADASIAAAMRWRFQPRTEAGQPVEAAVLVPITYALDEKH